MCTITTKIFFRALCISRTLSLLYINTLLMYGLILTCCKHAKGELNSDEFIPRNYLYSTITVQLNLCLRDLS